MNKIMKKVILDDQGQDFLNFEFDSNDSMPRIQNANMQGSIWNNQIIMNSDELNTGVFVQISKGFNEEIRIINYAVIDIMDV